MKLYYLHADGTETFIAEAEDKNYNAYDVLNSFGKDITKYLEKIGYKNFYSRVYQDSLGFWRIDFGSWTEFFIVRDSAKN